MTDDAASGEPSLKERIKRRREDRDDETSFLPAEPSGSEAAEYGGGFGGWAVAVSAAVARAQDTPADDEPPAQADALDDEEEDGAGPPPEPASFGELAQSVSAAVKQGPRLRERLKGHAAQADADFDIDEKGETAEDDGDGDGIIAAAPAGLAPPPETDEPAPAPVAEAPDELAPLAPNAPVPADEITAPPAVTPAPVASAPPQRVAAPVAARYDRPIIAAPPTPRRFARSEPVRTEPEPPRGKRATGGRARRPDRREEEAARKRTAARIAGGGTVMIADVLHPLHDWSTGGLAIAAEGQRYRIGDRALLEVEFDLGDYAVNLDLPGEVANRSAEQIGWRFTDVSDRQQAVLRSVAAASQTGGAFTAPGAGGGSRARQKPRGRRTLGAAGALIALVFNAAVIAFLAGALILALGGTLPAPVSTGEPAPARIVERSDHAAVAVATTPLVSRIAGVVLEWGAVRGGEVDNGEALVSLALDGVDADRDVIASPCDCILARILSRPGARVRDGDTVALLYPRGSKGYVQAMFNPTKAPAVGEPATVRLTDSGKSFEGVVTDVGRPADPGADIGLPRSIILQGNVFVRIETTPPIPPARAGDAAVVTISAREDAG
ncbi:MAG: hypothetical protein AcusKO_00050 [Acuticoccus sp.]